MCTATQIESPHTHLIQVLTIPQRTLSIRQTQHWPTHNAHERSVRVTASTAVNLGLLRRHAFKTLESITQPAHNALEHIRSGIAHEW